MTMSDSASKRSKNEVAVPAAPKKFVMQNELLRVYYDRFFPFANMFRWLSYCNHPDDQDQLNDKDYFLRREFTFTLKDDIYVRYKCFREHSSYKAAVVQHLPYKIDIGAVFNTAPKFHLSVGKFVPEEKELVFDIDMTDYDDVRTCCSGASICEKCWPLMNAAIKVMDKRLREDFGFKHLLWVYSGRRGIHCWVSDERGRKLTNSVRSALVTYLAVYVGAESKDQKVSLWNPLHPALQDSLRLLEPFFEDYLTSQGLLDHKFFQKRGAKGLMEDGMLGWGHLLKMIPDDDVRAALNEKWEENEVPVKKKLEQLRREISRGKKKNRRLNTTWAEIVFTYVYPRLDINVSKQLNHLLKSPFSVHPKTGRVCVPIDPEKCLEFDPFTVPTIADLTRELNEYKGPEIVNQRPVKDWQKTSLKPYIEHFSKEFIEPLEQSIRAARREVAESKNQMTF